ncbi:MAG: sulfotransferase family protein [Bacteroidia bacterium]
MPKPIALWSGPRNVSTALMYSFANREDVTVVDEPFFGYFLNKTGVWRPSRVEALEAMSIDFNQVLNTNLRLAETKQLFLKNMANHLVGIDLSVLKHFKNIILIREPRPVISSYTRQVEKPTLLDLCYQYQLDIITYLVKHKMEFYIINSDDIRNNPRKELGALCEYLELPFSKKMLGWKAGPRQEDGVWAKYWYHNVHKSTRFAPIEKSKYPIAEELERIYQECLRFYTKIMKIKNE